MDQVVNNLPIHGSGKEKTAFKLESDKRILISWKDESLRIPEFAKSAYYLQKIFHTLRPLNFIDVHFADASGVVVDRIPESLDFAKAVAIQKRIYKPRGDEPQNDEWMRGKKAEMLANQEFKDAYSLIQTLLIPNESDWGENELAEPINSTMVDSHPVIVELFNPIRTNWPNLRMDSLNEAGLRKTIETGIENGTLSEKDKKLIETYLTRYKTNNAALKNILSGQDTIQPQDGYETLQVIPEELAESTAPW